MTFALGRGWTLHLKYYATPHDYDEPGDVDAYFIPPLDEPVLTRTNNY